MARPKTGEITKASLIRGALADNPKASTADIVSVLAKKGITVSRNHVYLIKSKNRSARRRKKREQVAETTRATGISNPTEAVRRVKNLALDLGGMRHLKALVDVMSE